VSKYRLPKTLHGLLKLAVEDAKKIEQMDGYELNMGEWHLGAGDEEPGRPCQVCMAGAVMVLELNMPKERSVEPGDMATSDYGRRMFAINSMRCGQFVNAYRQLHNAEPEGDNLRGLAGLQVTFQHLPMAVDGRFPWHVYLEAAEVLKEAGL